MMYEHTLEEWKSTAEASQRRADLVRTGSSAADEMPVWVLFLLIALVLGVFLACAAGQFG